MTSRQTGWRWCSKCGGLVYFGYAVCPGGGVHDHSTSSDYTLNLLPLPNNDTTQQLQSEWKWCNKCQTLSFTGDGSTVGPCAAGGVHDHSGSGNYGLTNTQINQQGQANWRWCHKCQGLYYAGVTDIPGGKCQAGGAHDGSSSLGYVLSQDGRPTVQGGQGRWHWCRKCMMLAYDGYATCAGGGSHIQVGSHEHLVEFESSTSAGQKGWKWCNSCYSLVYSGSGTSGTCPARAGGHTLVSSAPYVLAMNDSGVSGTREIEYRPGWKWCGRCQMAWSTEAGQKRCPATQGGVHSSEGSGEYLVAAQSVESPPTPTACPSAGGCASTSVPAGGTGGSGSTLSTGAAAGIGVAVGVSVLAACAIVAVVWLRRRKRSRAPAYAQDADAPAREEIEGQGAFRADPKFARPTELEVAELAAPMSPREIGPGR